METMFVVVKLVNGKHEETKVLTGDELRCRACNGTEHTQLVPACSNMAHSQEAQMRAMQAMQEAMGGDGRPAEVRKQIGFIGKDADVEVGRREQRSRVKGGEER